jgi:hypothetical protein
MFVASYLGSCAASAASYCACWGCTTLTRETMSRRCVKPRQASVAAAAAALQCLKLPLLLPKAAPATKSPWRRLRPGHLTGRPLSPLPAPTRSARAAYSFLFMLAMMLAWIMRDFARPLIEKIPCEKRRAARRLRSRACAWSACAAMQPMRACTLGSQCPLGSPRPSGIMRAATGFEPSDKWFGQQAVYRVSMGNFMFFGALSLALLGVRTKGDKRGALLHQGNWAAKLAAWLLFSVLPFFMPNGVVGAYAWAARVGSGAFLVIQMLILLDFTAAWNEAWVAAGEDDERWLYGLLGLTVGAYAGTLGLAGLLYAFFKPPGAGSCSLNVALITLSLLLCLGFSALSVLPVSRRGSLFPSAVTSLYVMYLAYSALTSEPRDYACNGLAHRLNAASGGTLAVGMVLTLASVVYSALRAGGLLGD